MNTEEGNKFSTSSGMIHFPLLITCWMKKSFPPLLKPNPWSLGERLGKQEPVFTWQDKFSSHLVHDLFPIAQEDASYLFSY